MYYTRYKINVVILLCISKVMVLLVNHTSPIGIYVTYMCTHMSPALNAHVHHIHIYRSIHDNHDDIRGRRQTREYAHRIHVLQHIQEGSDTQTRRRNRGVSGVVFGRHPYG